MRLDQLEKFIVFKISVLPRPHIRRKVYLLDLAIKETHTYAPILILPPLVSWTRFSPGVGFLLPVIVVTENEALLMAFYAIGSVKFPIQGE